MIETISAWLGFSLVLIAIFNYIDQAATKKTKVGVAKWLKSMAKRSVSQTIVESPQWFIFAFDSVFGEKHLTWRCFRRSSIASIIAVFGMSIFEYFLNPIAWQQYFKSESVITGTLIVFVAILILALILNLVPDYVSLLETRWILNKTKNAGIRKLLVLLILDVILTGGIFISGAIIFVLIINILQGLPIYLLTFRNLLDMINWLQFPVSIFFYAAYFTSIWFYFFTAASIITKMVYSLGRFGNLIVDNLKVDNKPFLSMGVILVVFSVPPLALYLVIKGIIG